MNYSDELFSDLWKDVNGYRPTEDMKDEWNARTPRQKQELWTALVDELEQMEDDRLEIEQEAVDNFEDQIQNMGGTRSDAIRSILEDKDLLNEIDPEYVAYSLDLPYGKYTKEFQEVLETTFNPFVEEAA